MTLLLATSETRSYPSDQPPAAGAPRSDTLVVALDESYRALQGSYGEAAALSTTTEHRNRWRAQSQRLRHLRLGVDDSDLYGLPAPDPDIARRR